jgi:hypothetical protein
VFYNCPKVAVVARDFSKGLGAAIATKVVVDLGLTEITKEPLVCPKDKDGELPKAADVVVYEGLDYRQLPYVLLQLCEWHAVAAIKRRLINRCREVLKERCNELISMI